MSRFSKLLLAVALLAASISCTRTARIKGTIQSAPSSEVVVKLLDVNKYKVLDTVSTDEKGRFAYKVKVEKGQPEFVYIFNSEKKMASLLLKAGDRVKIAADTLGSVVVEGSEESVRLAQVEHDYAVAKASMKALSEKISNASEDEAAQLTGKLSEEYVQYYRSRVKYVMQNSTSLTVVPVLFQTLTSTLPVFGQYTDAIHFTNAADSLETVYPDSKYVKALRNEAKNRMTQMELANRISHADQVDYLDIELPDINGKKVRLSDVHKKLTLVYFWSAEDVSQNIFNIDVLKPVYEEFHSRGFDIYQVSLDIDNGKWASVVKGQGLPWTNVSDVSGNESRYITAYNLTKLPAAFMIGGNGMSGAKITDVKSLSDAVRSRLE